MTMSSLINIIEWPYSYLIEFNVYCNNPYLTKSGLSLMIVKMEVIGSKHERILQNLAGLVVLSLASLCAKNSSQFWTKPLNIIQRKSRPLSNIVLANCNNNCPWDFLQMESIGNWWCESPKASAFSAGKYILWVGI